MKTWEMPEVQELKIAETACPSACELAANNGVCTPGHVGTNPNCDTCCYNPKNQCTDRLS